MTHKYKNHGPKFGGPRLPGAWDLFMSGTVENVLVLVSANFLNFYWDIFSLLTTILSKLNYVHASTVGWPE